MQSQEEKRLEKKDKSGNNPWRKWGPYLSERQWGTVREDYSKEGSAWNYFPHDHARSRVYRWGEDGIAGISDDYQNLCFCLGVFWFLNARTMQNHSEVITEYLEIFRNIWAR